MGRYCSIAHASGYLAAFSTTLDAARKAQAEAEADTYVDTMLDGFDTDVWSSATTPKEIRHAADKLASARYLRLSDGAVNPSAGTVDGGFAEALEREARDAIGSIAGRGWYRSDEGLRVYRREKDRSPRFVEIIR